MSHKILIGFIVLLVIVGWFATTGIMHSPQQSSPSDRQAVKQVKSEIAPVKNGLQVAGQPVAVDKTWLIEPGSRVGKITK